MENETTDPQQPANQLNDNSLLQESPRKLEAEKAKKRFFIISRIALLVALTIFATVGAINLSLKIHNANKDRYKKLEITRETEPDNQPQNEQNQTDDRIKYERVDFGLSLKHKKGDLVSASSTFATNENYFQITGENSTPLDKIGTMEIEYGYFVRVNMFTLSTKTLEESVKLKRESMILECPGSAKIGVMAKTKVGNLDTIGFEIEDCGLNYIIDYGQIDNRIYEIIRGYKGDIGYEQIFKQEARNIIDSINFNIPVPEDNSPKVNTYNNKDLKIYFEYGLNLDTTCCTAEIPQGKDIQKLISVSEGTPQKTITFFIHNNNLNKTFDDVVKEQITALSEEYMVVKGVYPEGKRSEIELGNVGGILLTNYSWRNSSYIMVQVPESAKVLIISDMGISSDILSDILKTLVLGNKKKE